jgi:hypothetical protein
MSTREDMRMRDSGRGMQTKRQKDKHRIRLRELEIDTVRQGDMVQGESD